MHSCHGWKRETHNQTRVSSNNCCTSHTVPQTVRPSLQAQGYRRGGRQPLPAGPAELAASKSSESVGTGAAARLLSPSPTPTHCGDTADLTALFGHIQIFTVCPPRTDATDAHPVSPTLELRQDYLYYEEHAEQKEACRAARHTQIQRNSFNHARLPITAAAGPSSLHPYNLNLEVMKASFFYRNSCRGIRK